MLVQLLQSLQISLKDSFVIRCAITLVILLITLLVLVIQSGNVHKTRRRLRSLQRLGLTTSNMEDQYNPKFGRPPAAPVDGPARIKAMYLHPIKSCGPVEVDRALLTKTGFMFDRCFALATRIANSDDAAASKWRFISQRTKPLMSQLKIDLWLPHKNSDLHDPLVQSGGCLVATFEDPDLPSWINRVETLFYTWNLSAQPQISFIVPLNVTSAQAEELQVNMKTFGIHSRDARGLDMGGIPSVATALPKLKKFLEIPHDHSLTIFRCTPDTMTPTNLNLAPLECIGSPAVHGYTDQQPVNINSLSSVHAVSALLPTENRPMNALRFRANIWIENAAAYEEETWKRIRILSKSNGTKPRATVEPTLSVVCRTSRCTMPNVDPETGRFDTENPPPGKKRGKAQPSTALVQYRTVETGNKSALGYLGMHCVPEDKSLKEAEGQEAGLYIEVGDEIEVLERGAHLYGSTANDY